MNKEDLKIGDKVYFNSSNFHKEYGNFAVLISKSQENYFFNFKSEKGKPFETLIPDIYFDLTKIFRGNDKPQNHPLTSIFI